VDASLAGTIVPFEPVDKLVSELAAYALRQIFGHGRFGPTHALHAAMLQSPAMWKQFTPSTRRVIVAALEDAGSRGCESAGAEHLTIALARDGESVGGQILAESGIPLQQVIEQLIIATRCAGKPTPRAGKMSPDALELLSAALLESESDGQEFVGTDHILTALGKHHSLTAAKILQNAGLSPQVIANIVARRKRNPGILTRAQGRIRISKQGKIARLIRLPRIAWNVYVRKSLGHPRFVTHPYPLYRWLRQREPVRRDPLAPVWILTRYDDVLNMLRDPRFRKDPFASERLPRAVREQLGAADDSGRVDYETISMLFLDPPRHTEVRGVFARAFTPKSLADLRGRIEQVTAERLDRVAAAGRMDLIADLAYPLPVIVIAELLGFRAQDYEQIKRWSDDFAASLALNSTAEQQSRAMQSRIQIRAYFEKIVEELKKSPSDTLISRLLESEQEEGGLNREEIFSNSVLLLAAGHETTTNLIGNGVLALMRNRAQWKALVVNPELVESAVEEFLRFDPPVQWTSRLSGPGIEIGGVPIPPGEVVLGCVGAANRDPAKFTDPDRFDIQRADNKHLSFGTGIHFCLGAALARMEAQIALRGLVTRFPRMRLATRKVQWMKGLTFRGVTKLPLILK
jgi:hypothetical protein